MLNLFIIIFIHLLNEAKLMIVNFSRLFVPNETINAILFSD
ncbi:hypothetical protein AsAng_0023880 [Aureispira anguillae]|uniref:Uncharacterized protein n=1 Tax=Aureispira anguillae TaxID=2864201 RepID=A0A915YEP8_9BACT|nr:hypothetical protein AsAng_0023880 [Aureispira anguillae]